MPIVTVTAERERQRGCGSAGAHPSLSWMGLGGAVCLILLEKGAVHVSDGRGAHDISAQALNEQAMIKGQKQLVRLKEVTCCASMFVHLYVHHNCVIAP